MLGLYIHIPFCKSLCSYCDFPKRINTKNNVINSYINKLCDDINKLVEKNYIFDTIYIGGGTPNFLNNDELEYLLNSLEKIRLNANFEYTIEGNFELYDIDKINILKKSRINRISVGVETLNIKQGKLINRISDYNILKEKIKLLKNNGYTNINLDFMFGLPFETVDDVKENLAKIKELDVEHISYYSLILEEKSVLFNDIKKNSIQLPDEDLSADMYELIVDSLKDMGYHHYEISNFSKPGYESKHNLLYWSMDNYIGIGMSAASFIDGKRIYNSCVINDYLKDINIKEELSDKGEFFWLGLRKIDGISIDEFKNRYKEDPFKLYPIQELIDNNLLELKNNTIKLTNKGLDNGNYVFSKFLD